MNNFRAILGFTNNFFSAQNVGETVLSDASVALPALVEILARQTADERATKGTSHKNKFGFSKRHVTPGTAIAQKFLKGEDLTASEVTEACQIAYAYRQQLWMIALGAVPTNDLDLSRRA